MEAVKSSEYEVFSELDVHFAGFMERLAGGSDPAIHAAAKLASRSTREGHVCIDLRSWAGRTFATGETGETALVCPDPASWQRRLEACPVVGAPGVRRPLILDDRSRLYLYRYWKYEQDLLQGILRRVGDASRSDDVDEARLQEGLSRLFPLPEGDRVNWQAIAALAAVMNRFAVISGSPGTGKTTAVAKVLALLIEQADGRLLKIALAAPTGKAAVRLQEAIGKAKGSLVCRETVRDLIPEKTSTVHRLMGTLRGSPYFRHHAANPLPHDVIVVDEASMIDLPLFSKLIQAARPEAKLILLGDRDQLASVEAGAVLGDICGDGPPNHFSAVFRERVRAYGFGEPEACRGVPEPGVHDGIVSLQHNFRFGRQSGIGSLSAAVVTGNGSAAIDILKSGDYPDVRWVRTSRQPSFRAGLAETIRGGYGLYLSAVAAGSSPEEIFRLFDDLRVLCALRQGPYGVVALNGMIEDILGKGPQINPGVRNYPGRPVMVTVNDYELGLFNGDVGIMLFDREAQGDLRVFFRDASGSIRRFHPLRLPGHETVYAMTIHKSQGSEFEKVVIILPDRDSPVLTRELLYTGITRARTAVEIRANEGIIKTAVSRRIERTSGLRDALWGVAEKTNSP